MKKILLGGIAALAVVLATEKQASAWINSRFSVGLNWSYQSGGNNFLWGLFRNGQPPGPEAYGPGFPGGFPGGGYPGGGYPGGGYPGNGPNGFPYFGSAPGGDGTAPVTMPTAPPPT